MYILELTIGFEANTQINSESKASKYHPLQQTLLPNYKNLETEIGTALCAIGAEGTLTFFCYVVILTVSCTLSSFSEKCDCISVDMKMILKF